jgi:hypothetical protein
MKSLTHGALLTPTVTDRATNAVTGEVTPAATNYAPNAALLSGIETGRQFAPLAPAPFGWLIDGALALAAAGLGLLAKKKNGELFTAQTKAETAQAVTRAIIAGVEVIGHAETKASIQNVAAGAGVESQLFPLVQSVSATIK